MYNFKPEMFINFIKIIILLVLLITKNNVIKI